jgi:hypothetical protein
MAAFRYTGNSSLPQVMLGLTFTADGWTEVPDDLAERLSRHPNLEQDDADTVEGDSLPQPKRRGRPPKVRD